MSRRNLLLLFLACGVSGGGGFIAGQYKGTTRDVSLKKDAPPRVAIPMVNQTVEVARETSTPEALRLKESQRLADQVARHGNSLAAEDERQHMIEAWAELDPSAAINFVRNEMKGDRQAQAMAAVVSIWGKKDPAAAWSWVSKEMPTATHHFDNLLEVFGRNSPETAARYAAAYSVQHPEATLEVHLAALLGITYKGDFDAARALVDLNGSLDPIIRGNLDNFIAGNGDISRPKKPRHGSCRFLPVRSVTKRSLVWVNLGRKWIQRAPPRLPRTFRREKRAPSLSGKQFQNGWSTILIQRGIGS